MGQMVAVLAGGNLHAGSLGKLAVALVVVDWQWLFEPIDIELGQLPGKFQRSFQIKGAVGVHQQGRLVADGLAGGLHPAHVSGHSHVGVPNFDLYCGSVHLLHIESNFFL